MNLNPQGETIFDIGILPDPKQHIIHALYVGFDESEDDDERSAIERGLRAIVTFQERVGEEPIKRNISETENFLNTNLNAENEDEKFIAKLIDDDDFNKFADLRDNELALHFQHLKIESTEE